MRWSSGGSSVGWVVLGGSAGTAVRLAGEAQLPTPSDLPLPTLVVNLVGALVLGALLERLSRSSGRDGDDPGPTTLRRREAVRLLVGTGFCGGLTTYSTFALEVDLLLAGRPVAGALYAALTVLLGVAAAAAGVLAAGRWGRARAAGGR